MTHEKSHEAIANYSKNKRGCLGGELLGGYRRTATGILLKEDEFQAP